MIRRALASLILAGSVLVPTGYFLAGTAHAANSQLVDVTCPAPYGTFTVQVNLNSPVGHVVGTKAIGVALGVEGNAGNANGLQGRLVSCSSSFGPLQVLFPAGR